MALGTEMHVALPTLVGAPAYSRPPRPVQPAARPIDPDDFPLEAEMTEDERRVLAGGWLSAPVSGDGVTPRGFPEARHFTLRSIADRLRQGT